MKISHENLLSAGFRKFPANEISGAVAVFTKTVKTDAQWSDYKKYTLYVDQYDFSQYNGPKEMYGIKAYFQDALKHTVTVEYSIPKDDEHAIENLELFFASMYVNMGFVEYL